MIVIVSIEKRGIMTKERLKELRKEAGLTQNQVAEMIGVQGRNYQRLEITDALPPTRHLLALADYYNVSVDYILGRTDKREINLSLIHI